MLIIYYIYFIALRSCHRLFIYLLLLICDRIPFIAAAINQLYYIIHHISTLWHSHKILYTNNYITYIHIDSYPHNIFIFAKR